MTLKGNLEVLNLSDIFQSLSLNQHTGTLRVSDGKREKLIHFTQGEITLLASEKRVKLGEMLVASGKISVEDLDYALQQQKKNKKRLGEVLIDEGFVSEDDIAEVVKQQIESEIYDLFLWKKADFEFLIDYMPEKLKNPSHGVTRLQFNTSSLIMEALRRLDEWGVISQDVSTLKEVYKVVDPSPEALAAVDLPDRVKGEIKYVDGERTVEQISDETMLSEFELVKLIYELKKHGVIAPLTPQELSDKAEDALAHGKFRQASALYDRLSELLPKNLSIRWHLAESLKALGDEGRALEQYLYVAQKLEGTRDRSELAKTYRAILDLAPDNLEVLEKLRALDKAKWQKSAIRSGGAALVLLLLAGGALVYSGRSLSVEPVRRLLARVFRKSHPDPSLEQEKGARPLLEDQQQKYRLQSYKEAFAIGDRILRDYPLSASAREVLLPIQVFSDPPGKAVLLDGVEVGRTNGTFQFAPGDRVKSPKLKVELKDGARLVKSLDVDRTSYQALTVDCWKAPAWATPPSGAAIRAAPVFANGVAYFVSLDGRLYGYDVSQPPGTPVLAGQPLARPSEDSYGLAVGGLALAQDIVLYGTLDGDVGGFDLSTSRFAFPPVHVSDQPLLAPPALLDGVETLAVAGDDGDIYLLSVRQHAVVGRFQTANRVTADLVAKDGLLFVAGRDNRVVAFDPRLLERGDGAGTAFARPGRGDYQAPPRLAGERWIVAGDVTGELACLDRRTGAVTWTADARGPIVGIDAADDAVYVTVAKDDGSGAELAAFSLGTGRALYRVVAPRSPGRPVVMGDAVLVPGDGSLVAFERASLRERWTARSKTRLRGVPALLAGRVYIGGEDGVLYAFDPD